jgi:hypothetical protein
MLLRPTTTAFLPAISTFLRFNSSKIPLGVHEVNSGSAPRFAKFPIFSE